MAGRPEELHRDRAVRIGELGRTARHGPGTAVPRRAERGVVGILRRARRRADDRENLPPRGRSPRRAADGSVECRRLAAAVFLRSLRRRTAADRRYGHEGRCLRSDRRDAAGLPHSRGCSGVDGTWPGTGGRGERAGHVRARPPGARRNRRQCRRRALDHRSQRRVEEWDGEHVDGGGGDPVADAPARSRSSGARRDRRRLGRAAADCVRQRGSAAAGSGRRAEARSRREIRSRSAAVADRSATVVRIDCDVARRRGSGRRSSLRELWRDRVARSDRRASPGRGRDRRPRFTVRANPLPGYRRDCRPLAGMAPQQRRARGRTPRRVRGQRPRRPLPRAHASSWWRRNSRRWWCC